MDAVEVLALQHPLPTIHVPGHVAGVRHDLHVGRRCDEALLLLLEVLLVGEGQGGARLFEHRHRVLRGQLAFGVVVPDRLAHGRGFGRSGCGIRGSLARSGCRRGFGPLGATEHECHRGGGS